jgi:hypothetical protein
VTAIEPPVVERWAYGGVRVLSGGRVLAWVTEAGAGEEVLFEPPRRGGRFTVGLLYPVRVTRVMGRLRVHGWPIKSRGRVDRELLALLRAEHHAAQAHLALLRMKGTPVGRIKLDEAIEPLRVIARELTGRADRAALLASVVAEVSAALPAPSLHREATNDG